MLVSSSTFKTIVILADKKFNGIDMKLKIGDSVIVNQGVKEPDLEEFELSGWQGRVVDIDTKSDKQNILITIEWDSLTMNQIPSKYIVQSEVEGFDWTQMTLFESEMGKTIPRDTQENVIELKDELSEKYYLESLGEEGLRISKILKGVDLNDEMKCLKKWFDYLDKKLNFPVQAMVSDAEYSAVLKNGDKVSIKSLHDFIDIYGIIAAISFNRTKHKCELCDLKVIDKTKSDFQLIEDYKTWFANR